MADRLNMDKINSLPQPLTALFFGGGSWPIHDIDVETGVLRIDVSGELQVCHIGEIHTVVEPGGTEHDVEELYAD